MLSLKNLRDSGLIPDITYHILLKLIILKQKQAKYKRIRAIWGLLLVTIYVGLIYYFFNYKLSSTDQFYHFSVILVDPFLWFLGIAAIGATIIWTSILKKYDDADEDFDELREEVINRHLELWYKHLDDKGKRDAMILLDKEADINLYHK